MPRKIITQDVKDQNRESQRRSRARRTEVMSDLKKQVEDYQRQGAVASSEMQKVAQAVAFENQRLRDLLKIHGVSQDDIDRYFTTTSAPPSSTQAVSYEPSSLRCRACGSTSIVAEKLPVSLPVGQSDVSVDISQQRTFHPQPAASVQSRAISSPRTDKKTAVTAASTALVLPPRSTTLHEFGDRRDQKESNNGHQSHFRTSYTSKNNKSCDSEISLDVKTPLPMPRDMHYASKKEDHTDTMETSCDTAASILVDLHHHADTERARAALGCKGPNSCTVNNIKIFQLLENFS